MREFSIISNLMHSILKDKKEINSLVEYEHKFYDDMKLKISNLVLKLDESEKELITLHIPDKPCMSHVRRSVYKEKAAISITD